MIIEDDFVINNPSGLHARPASLFVKAANTFTSRIKVSHAGREADAKSILGILSLGASKGSTVHAVAEGEDAKLAIAKLKELVVGGFAES